jgi:hypothetical protein
MIANLDEDRPSGVEQPDYQADDEGHDEMLEESHRYCASEGPM